MKRESHKKLSAKTKKIRCIINGSKRVLEVPIHETLANVLREQLELTGTKIGCNHGECGACTVILNGKAVLSCLMLAVECDESEIVTIEGLSKPDQKKLDPIQEAFIEHNGIQCGFCTPGMVMSAKALLMKNNNPSKNEIKEAIQGNLCRCTGYEQIIESIAMAARKMRNE